MTISDFQCPFCSPRRADAEADPRHVRPGQGPHGLEERAAPVPQRRAPAAEAAHDGVRAQRQRSVLEVPRHRVQEPAGARPTRTTRSGPPRPASTRRKFKAALAAKKFTAKVDEDMALATKIGANGTPAFRINGVTAQRRAAVRQVQGGHRPAARRRPEDAAKAGTKPDGQVYVDAHEEDTRPPEAPAARTTEAGGDPEEDDKTVWKVPVERRTRSRARPTRSSPSSSSRTSSARSASASSRRSSRSRTPTATRFASSGRTSRSRSTRAQARRELARRPTTRRATRASGTRTTSSSTQPAEARRRRPREGSRAASASTWPQGEGGDRRATSTRTSSTPSVDLADDFQARGTPHFFINGRRLVGAQPFEKFKKIIDEEIAKAQGARGQGRRRAPRSTTRS